jgi:DNA repair exonuclease SbcCD ATPase subunit
MKKILVACTFVCFTSTVIPSYAGGPLDVPEEKRGVVKRVREWFRKSRARRILGYAALAAGTLVAAGGAFYFVRRLRKKPPSPEIEKLLKALRKVVEKEDATKEDIIKELAKIKEGDQPKVFEHLEPKDLRIGALRDALKEHITEEADYKALIKKVQKERIDELKALPTQDEIAKALEDDKDDELFKADVLSEVVEKDDLLTAEKEEANFYKALKPKLTGDNVTKIENMIAAPPPPPPPKVAELKMLGVSAAKKRIDQLKGDLAKAETFVTAINEVEEAIEGGKGAFVRTIKGTLSDTGIAEEIVEFAKEVRKQLEAGDEKFKQHIDSVGEFYGKIVNRIPSFRLAEKKKDINVLIKEIKELKKAEKEKEKEKEKVVEEEEEAKMKREEEERKRKEEEEARKVVEEEKFEVSIDPTASVGLLVQNINTLALALEEKNKFADAVETLKGHIERGKGKFAAEMFRKSGDIRGVRAEVSDFINKMGEEFENLDVKSKLANKKLVVDLCDLFLRLIHDRSGFANSTGGVKDKVEKLAVEAEKKEKTTIKKQTE